MQNIFVTLNSPNHAQLRCGPGDWTTCKDISRKTFEPVPIGEEWRAQVINELIDIRDGLMDIIEWTPKEVEDTLTYLCSTKRKKSNSVKHNETSYCLKYIS